MLKMDHHTSTKEITERHSNILASLESELNTAEKKYSSDIDFLRELKNSELKKYNSSKERASNEIKTAIEGDNFSALSLLEKMLVVEKRKYEKNIWEFDNEKNELNSKYNSLVCDIILKHFYQSSPLIEKRIRDSLEFTNAAVVMPKEYEEAKEALNRINSHMRKEMNKETFWGKKYAAAEKEAKALVKEFEAKKAEKEAGERYTMILPIWLGANYCGNEICDVEILSPIAKTFDAKAKIEDAVLDEAIRYGDSLNDTNKDLVGCRIKAPKDKLNDLKAGIEKRISDSLGKINIKAKIYETYLKPVKKEMQGALLKMHGKSYGLDEIAKMKNMKKMTLYAIAGGYGPYKTHPIRPYCSKVMDDKGKQVYRIKEEGLSLLDKQNNEIPADKKAVSVKEANKRLGYNADSTVCYTYLKNGALEPVKAGSHVYITENSLDNFISTHRKSEKSGRWLSMLKSSARLRKNK